MGVGVVEWVFRWGFCVLDSGKIDAAALKRKTERLLMEARRQQLRTT